MFRLPARFPINFCESKGKDHDLLSPNSRALLTKVQFATEEDIDHIISMTPVAQKKMQALKAFERAAILRSVAEKIKTNSESMAQLIAAEGGKPLKDAKLEVARAQSTLELCAEECLRLGGENIPMERTKAAENHVALNYRESIGPVLAISAFNHPLNNLAHQVGPAIAAGSAVVLKPASTTPITAFKLEKFLLEAGLPPECITVVNAETDLIEKLVASKAFDFLTFIGSAQVGWGLQKIMAPGARHAMEHGGMAWAIIRADADLKTALPGLVKGSFYHAGQVCISTQRIFVHKSIYQELLSAFVTEAGKLKVGSALDETTDVGPLIRPEEVKRIRSWLNEAVAAGASIEIGNEVSGEEGQYLSPTVVTDVPREAKLMKEEVFGPVVCMNSYEDEEELVEYLNTNDYIFQGCIHTRDVSHALALAKAINSMTTVINDASTYRVDWMPFGGHKLSGLGLGGVKYAVHEMTRLKQIILKY